MKKEINKSGLIFSSISILIFLLIIVFNVLILKEEGARLSSGDYFKMLFVTNLIEITIFLSISISYVFLYRFEKKVAMNVSIIGLLVMNLSFQINVYINNFISVQGADVRALSPITISTAVLFISSLILLIISLLFNPYENKWKKKIYSSIGATLMLINVLVILFMGDYYSYNFSIPNGILLISFFLSFIIYMFSFQSINSYSAVFSKK